MSDMSLPPDGNAGVLFDGITFATYTPLKVPFLPATADRARETVRVGTSFHASPVAVLDFIKYVVSHPQLFERPLTTRWGEGTVTINRNDSSFGFTLDVAKVADRPQERLRLIMNSNQAPADPDIMKQMRDIVHGTSKIHIIDAELAFAATGHFAVRQFARMTISSNGSLASTDGIAATAIASGAEMLALAASNAQAVKQTNFWSEIRTALASGVTPWAALCTAMLFEGDKHMTGEVMQDGKDVFAVESAETKQGYSPGGPLMEEAPLFTVDYVPQGTHSDVFDEAVPTPMIEIVHNVAMSPTGLARPYNKLVQSFFTGLSKQRPTTFPLSMRLG